MLDVYSHSMIQVRLGFSKNTCVCVCVLPAGHQGLLWTPVCSERLQLSDQREVQQAQTQNTGQPQPHMHAALHLTGHISCLRAELFYSMWRVAAVVVRIWSRWPESRTERRTDRPSWQRQRASKGKCWGVLTHTHGNHLHFPLEIITLLTSSIPT